MTFETGRAAEVEVAQVSTREDFANVMHAVLEDFHATGESEWENRTLDRFLEALAAFAGARVMDGGDQETPSWQLFAEMVVAATGYE